GLRVQVGRQYNAKVDVTYVFKPDPQPGERIAKGNYVTIFSSLGPPKTDVPSVVGEKLDQALADLQKANLKGHSREVDSNHPQGEVVSQRLTAGASVQEGSTVTLQGSKGPKTVAAPNVTGATFEAGNARPWA